MHKFAKPEYLFSPHYVAAPEKAIFDTVYIRAAAGRKAFFTELQLPDGFDLEEVRRWVERIESARLRTLVSRRIREVLRSAAAIEATR